MAERFDYSDYEFQTRLPNYTEIKNNQRKYIGYFKNCKNVLDLACGQGLFLELLKEKGIKAMGVDANKKITEYASKKGLTIINSDVFKFLKTTQQKFDGIFCSHFIEHLEFEKVIDLIEIITQKINKNGILVLVFPNPESIRMQLQGFWKDPQHVRFYHHELIIALLKHYGFKIEETNIKNNINKSSEKSLLHYEPLAEQPDKSNPIKYLLAVLRHTIHVALKIDKLDRQTGENLHKINHNLSAVLNYINWNHPDEVVIIARFRQ